MPQIDPVANRSAPRPKPKPKRVVKKKPSSTAPPRQADQGDSARSNPAPVAPPVKVRKFAKPNRPKPKAVIKKAVKQQEAAVKKAVKDEAETKRVVRQVSKTYKPVPSPDATDTARPSEQRKRDADAAAKSVRDSRVKYLRKKNRGSGARYVKKVLEGGVNLNATTMASTGAGPTTLTVKRKKGGGGGFQFAAMKPPVSRSIKIDSSTVAGRFAQDVTNLPAQVIPSLYVPAAGVVEAVKSGGKDTSRLRKLGKDIDESDPIYNLAAAGVNAIKGDGKAAKKRLKRAKKAASEHPGFTAAEVLGAKGTVGRTGGTAARTGVAGKNVKKAASTQRQARTVPGTSLREDRSYSPDVITKGAQVLVEKVQRGRVKRKLAKAKKVEKESPAEAVRLRERAAQINPDRNMSESAVLKRVDEHVDAQETVRRLHRGDAVNESRALVKDAKDAGPVGNLLAQGIVRADVQDIKDYVAELKGARPTLSRDGKRANKELVRGLDKALVKAEKGKVNLESLKPVVARYRESQAKREQALDKRGMLPESEAAKAAAIPYAVRRMKAKVTNEHRVTAATSTKESLDLVRARVRTLEKEKVHASGKHKVTRGQDGAKEPQSVYMVGTTRFATRADADELGHLAGGGEVRKVSLTLAESKRVGEAARIDRALTAAKVDLRKAEAAHSGARKVRGTAELVDEHGKPLSLDAIRQHMKDNDEPTPSWLSQSPNARGAHNFYQSSSKPPSIRNDHRTGEATKGGTFDAHPDTLVEGAAKQQGLIDAFDGFHAYLNEFAMKGKSGKIRTVQTRKQADAAIREAMVDEDGTPRPGAIKMVAVRVNPFDGSKEQLKEMLDGTDDASPGGSKALDDAISAALKGDGDGPWALVPEAAAKRLQEHMNIVSPTNAWKVGQKANSAFRKTVLSTSLPWMAGNLTEGAMRATLARSGPRSYMTGRRVLKKALELDKEKGERSTARTVGGGHFGSVEKQAVHLNTDAMTAGKLKKVSSALGAFWRVGENAPKGVPSPYRAASLWQGYTHIVMDVVNKTVETQIQTAMLGKAVHDSELMDAPLLRATEAAVDKAAHGILDQNTASRLGRQVDTMYGKYGKYSPGMRQAIAMYTPFVAWTLNATVFLLRTLPRDHPTALLLIAASENATEEWRKDHGLDKFIEGHVPGWLQGSIPGPGGSHFRAPNRYTPFALGADPLGSYTGAVLPMVSGVIAAGKGKDWQGHDLKDDSDAGKAKAATKAILGSTVPFLALGQRVADKGPKAATLDAVIGKVAPEKKKVRRSSSSSSKPGTIVGAGAGAGGKIVGPGASSGSGGKIVP